MKRFISNVLIALALLNNIKIDAASEVAPAPVSSGVNHVGLTDLTPATFGLAIGIPAAALIALILAIVYRFKKGRSSGKTDRQIYAEITTSPAYRNLSEVDRSGVDSYITLVRNANLNNIKIRNLYSNNPSAEKFKNYVLDEMSNVGGADWILNTITTVVNSRVDTNLIDQTKYNMLLLAAETAEAAYNDNPSSVNVQELEKLKQFKARAEIVPSDIPDVTADIIVKSYQGVTVSEKEVAQLRNDTINIDGDDIQIKNIRVYKFADTDPYNGKNLMEVKTAEGKFKMVSMQQNKVKFNFIKQAVKVASPADDSQVIQINNDVRFTERKFKLKAANFEQVSEVAAKIGDGAVDLSKLHEQIYSTTIPVVTDEGDPDDPTGFGDDGFFG